MKRFFCVLVFISTFFFVIRSLGEGSLKADMVIDGEGGSLSLSPTFSLSVEPGATLTLRNITVKNIRADSDLGPEASRLIMHDNTSLLILENATLSFEGDYSFTQGGITFYENNVFTGTGKFVYNSTYGSTFASNGSLMVDRDLTFSYDSIVGNYNDLLNFEDSTSVFHLKTCTLHVTTTGLQMTKGTLLIEGAVSFFSESVVLDYGIIWGDGTSANNLIIDIPPAGDLNYSGPIRNKNV